MPMWKSSDISESASGSVPVKECTRPRRGRDGRWGVRRERKSECAAREWRNRGRERVVARWSCAVKCVRCVEAGERKRRS